MTEKDEASRLAMFYLDRLIRIADKYGIDRERFCKICVMALVTTVDTINFKKYKSRKEIK